MKNILLFLALAFGISWASIGLQYVAGIEYGSAVSILLVATTVMGGPAIAAFILRKWISPGDFFSYGFRLRRSSLRGWLMVPLIFFSFILITVAVMSVGGNLLHIEGFGQIKMDAASVGNSIRKLAVAAGQPPVAVQISGWALLAVAMISGVIAGITVNLIPCFGEEFGWRGCLAFETRRWGFLKANLFTGIVWGLWHAPLIVQGHNYPGFPVSGIFMMMFFCTGLAFVLGYIRLKVRSAVACAAFHGMINASGATLMILAQGQNPLFGVAGIAGGTAGIILTLILFVLDKKTFSDAEIILSETK